jgi:hypothetical protein
MVWTIALLATAAPAAQAGSGCATFVDPPADSQCRKDAPEIVWTNRPERLDAVKVTRRSWDPNPVYDPLVGEPALSGAGVAASADALFEFRGSGRSLLEVFLYAPSVAERETAVYELEVDGKVVDREGQRANPQFSLCGAIDRGQRFRVRVSKRFVLVALRWTPQEEFESRLVPLYRERGRTLIAGPFLPDGKRRAPEHVAQIFSRLAASRQSDVRSEAVLGRTRLVYWRLAENHAEVEAELLKGLIREGGRLFPENRLYRQMRSAMCLEQNILHGLRRADVSCEGVQPVAWDVTLPPAPENAPAWAVTQRKLAARMDALTRWWVEKRQRPDGQLGGGWGDDVELLRSWGPQALGFGSAVAYRGLVRLADGMWRHTGLVDGFPKEIQDSEHVGEDVADTQPLLAAASPEDAAIRARLKLTTACSENWIRRQPDGHWRFRGSWFNCAEYDANPTRTIDVHYNVRAMGPAMWYAYLTRDKFVIERLTRWAESWLAAMRSTAHGKPAGVIPSVLNSVDGGYLIRSERWDKPNTPWTYYNWSGYSQEGLTSLFLAVYELTGERRWLDAAGETFRPLERCGEEPRICAEIVSSPASFYSWRRISGDARYDRHFPENPVTDAASALPLMEKLASETEARFGVNFDMMTSEVMWTDRVYYRLPPSYSAYLFGGDAPRGERYPLFAVTWPVREGEFVARAVIDATPSRLHLRLYNFGGSDAELPMRAWQLRAGRYRVVTRGADGSAIGSRELEIARPAEILRIAAPAGREVDLTVEPARDAVAAAPGR